MSKGQAVFSRSLLALAVFARRRRVFLYGRDRDMSVLVESGLTEYVPDLDEPRSDDHGDEDHECVVLNVGLIFPDDIEHKELPP